MLASLREERYAGWYVLEQDVVLRSEPSSSEGPVAAARRSVEHLERMILA